MSGGLEDKDDKMNRRLVNKDRCRSETQGQISKY